MAEAYWPFLQLCFHQYSCSTSMLPSGRADEASFSNRVRRASFKSAASSSLNPVFSASWQFMLPKVV